MAQPFHISTVYRSQVWPDFNIQLRDDHIFAEAGTQFQTISSALWGGGMGSIRRFINWKVPLDYSCDQPFECMYRQIVEWGYPAEDTIGLQTAASLENASIQEMNGDQFSMLCCATVGTSNAARAGTPRTAFPAYQAGTINIMIWIDAKLTPAAMINGILTATEAKTAALQDLRVQDERGRIATGTTTDSLVLAVTQSERYDRAHLFAGTATTIGNGIGRLVYRAVYEAFSRQA